MGARHRARGAVPLSRIERLQELTAELSRAPTVAAVTDVVVTTITEELGAGSALVALLEGDDTATFEIVRAVGYLPTTLEQWTSFSMDAPLPAGDALRRGAMVVFESLADRDQQYPALRGVPSAHEAWAIVPLIVDGEPVGIVSFGFASPRRLVAADRSFVQAVVDQCAQAVHRARLYDEQRTVARQRGFLNRAGEAFAEASSYRDVQQLVVELATPELGDGAALFLGVPGGLSSAASRHTDPGAGAVLSALDGGRAFTADPLLHEVFRTGTPRTLRTDEALPDPAGAAGPADRAAGDLLVLPLQSRVSTLGVLVLVQRGAGTSAASDWSLAESYCSLAGLHCDNARLLEEQTRIAQHLQASLLPPMLPHIPGLEVATAYVAGGTGADVGGDFYDLFDAGEGRWVAVTGDVRGRGVDAAATTGLARHTVRAAAVPRADPSAVVRRLNEVLLAHEPLGLEPRFCAVCLMACSLTSAGATITVCCAGHPLPWLVRADGVAREVGVPGTVAGVVADPDLADETIVLGAGDTLVAFTDGISERRCEGVFFEDLLATVLSGTADLDVRAVAARVRDQATAFGAEEPDDDMAVLVLRVAGRAPPVGRPATIGERLDETGSAAGTVLPRAVRSSMPVEGRP
ncbi:MAG: SpoIIE family protein phosphatase [Egibacteraceae bacterium]